MEVRKGNYNKAFHCIGPQLKKSDPSVAGSKRCESDNMKMMDARAAIQQTFYPPQNQYQNLCQVMSGVLIYV